MTEKKNILLGICGGIAAYKSCELVRLLIKAGHQVTTVMTQSATEFIHPNTFHALSSHPVYSDSEIQNQTMTHIQLTRQADVFLIAPATANTIAKISNGICDNLLTTLVAARNCPLALAPAMNTHMWLNIANQRNIRQLQEDGVFLFGPDTGSLACGENGAGRMLEAKELLENLPLLWTEKKLTGKKVILTAGATYEAIDPVRGITNLSSGKMGIVLAKACLYAGAEVKLILGQTNTEHILPKAIEIIHAHNARQMEQAVFHNIADADIFIGVAAISDYRVKNVAAEKIKKESATSTLTLELVQNPDILAAVASLPNPPLCVGFAAESEHLLAYAEQKRQNKKLPMLVANLVNDTMGKDQTKMIILDNNGSTPYQEMNKNDAAKIIIDHLGTLLNNRN